MGDGSKIREIDVWIDDFTPCLKDNLTGEVVNTHVGILHPYQFCVFEKEMQEIIKTYSYAYTGEEI